VGLARPGAVCVVEEFGAKRGFCWSDGLDPEEAAVLVEFEDEGSERVGVVVFGP
jgi:hypothetical protein